MLVAAAPFSGCAMPSSHHDSSLPSVQSLLNPPRSAQSSRPRSRPVLPPLRVPEPAAKPPPPPVVAASTSPVSPLTAPHSTSSSPGTGSISSLRSLPALRQQRPGPTTPASRIPPQLLTTPHSASPAEPSPKAQYSQYPSPDAVRYLAPVPTPVQPLPGIHTVPGAQPVAAPMAPAPPVHSLHHPPTPPAVRPLPTMVPAPPYGYMYQPYPAVVPPPPPGMYYPVMASSMVPPPAMIAAPRIHLDSNRIMKPKRKRATSEQVMKLNQVFEKTFFPSSEMRMNLALELGMTPRTVQIWFQNRRQGWRSEHNRAIPKDAGNKSVPGSPESDDAPETADS